MKTKEGPEFKEKFGASGGVTKKGKGMQDRPKSFKGAKGRGGAKMAKPTK
jgi:hypothetical protein